jgi:hypothetical protein
MVGDVDISRTFRMMQLTQKLIPMERQAWDPKVESSPLNSEMLAHQKTTLKLVELSNELNGDQLNLYA